MGFGVKRIGWFIIVVLGCLSLSDCKFPRRLGANDISDAPQADARTALRSSLSDLTYLPNPQLGQSLREFAFGAIYSHSRDLAVLSAPDECRSLFDTCYKRVTLYRWNVSRSAFIPTDSLASRSFVHLALFDLTDDASKDILLYTTTPTRKLGLEVLGFSNRSNTLVMRFRSDTILPQVTALPARRYALIEYDSAAARLMTGISVKLPKRYYRVSGELFTENPSDSFWSMIVQHFRDSTHQTLLLYRDEMEKLPHPDAALQRNLTSSAIAEALMDSSWSDAQLMLQRLLTDLSTQLSSASYSVLLKLSLMNRASAFVRQSLHYNPAMLEALGDLDDALLSRDQNKAHLSVLTLYRESHTSEPLYRAASALISHNTLIKDANLLLRRALEIEPRSASALRLRARSFELLSEPDSAQYLLYESLRYDSVSAEALRIRQQFAPFR